MRPYTSSGGATGGGGPAAAPSSTTTPPATSTGSRARGSSVGSLSNRLGIGAPNYIPIPAPPSAAALSATNSRRSPSGGGGGTPGSPSGGGQPQPSPSSPRSSFLPSFMTRNRPRASTLSRQQQQQAQSPSRGLQHQQQQSTMNTSTSSSSQRSQGGRSGTPPSLARSVSTPAPFNNSNTTNGSANADVGAVMTHRIRLVPHLETYRSLHFEPVVRDCRPSLGPEYEAAVPESSEGAYPHGTILKVGRFTEKAQAALERQQAAARAQVEGATQALMAASLAAEQQAQAGGTTTTTAEDLAQAFEGEAMLPSMRYSPTSRPPAGAGGGGSHGSTKVAFKSKVVSRAHAEIWCEEGGKFFIRDTKSSSGTFLNHIRLSNPNQESRSFPIKDGDVIQLGVDYQGGTEEMYRCIKMKVEIGRERRREQSNYNKEAMKQLRALGGAPDSPTASIAGGSSSGAVAAAAGPATSTSPVTASAKKEMQKAGVCDCCIFTVAQALFIAPCSHAFHYKCIRPMLQMHHPGFACPLCRSFHNLEADVELDDWEVASRRQSTVSRRESSVHLPVPTDELPVPPVPPLPVTSIDQGDDGVERQMTRVPLPPASTSEELDPSDLIDDEPSSNRLRATESFTSSGDRSSGSAPTASLSSSSSRNRDGLSLGSLPIPSMSRGGPPTITTNNEFDAATPMNNTFLSTLAESMGAMTFTGGGAGSTMLPTHAEEEDHASPVDQQHQPERGHSRVAGGSSDGGSTESSGSGSGALRFTTANNKTTTTTTTPVPLPLRTTHSGRPYGGVSASLAGGNDDDQQQQVAATTSGEGTPTQGVVANGDDNAAAGRSGDGDAAAVADVEAAAAEQQEKMARRDMMYT